MTPETQAAADAARAAGRSTWRVSSTVFAHVASDELLEPLASFATPAACAAYPSVSAGWQVQQELEAIKLKRTQEEGEGQPGGRHALHPEQQQGADALKCLAVANNGSGEVLRSIVNSDGGNNARCVGSA